jgi:hypothetical protein
MQDFDITTTATLRPELLKRTLNSHIEYLFKEDIQYGRLIINIDMVGAEGIKEQQKKLQEIYNIIDGLPIRSYFLNLCNTPNFAKAFFWCWDKVECNFVFNLEEDWEMTRPIDFKQMMNIMEEDERIVHLRLSSFVSTTQTCKNWNKFTEWNGKFFEVAKEDKCVIGWAGHPSLNKSDFMRRVIRLLDRNKNPEKQIKGRRYNHPINDIISSSTFGVFTPQNSPKVVLDIGRKWMIENGYSKKGSKAFFTEWKRNK